MKNMTIWLRNLQMLQQFVEDCSQVDAELEAVSGDFTANPKSIMGMMTLDLLHPLELRVVSGGISEEEFQKLFGSYAPV